MIPGEQPNMMQLLQQAQQMQQQLQEQLANVTATGTAGGGLVTATVSGSGELTALVIAPEAIDPSDPETLADLVVAAVRDATRAAADLADRAAAEAMGPLTGGLGGAFPGLPGF